MSRFVINDDNTVTDTTTGLTWTRNTIAKDVTHEGDADKAVAALGDGWRMPTVEELLTLVDRIRHAPAIDIEAFPDTENDWYWTSTPTAWNASAVWVVGFGYGDADGGPRDDGACVRAVRSSPAGQ